jgi:hypothetical protein
LRNLLAILLISFVLLLAWSLAVPSFESPDEDAHWAYAVELREKGSLPIFAGGETHSPP